MLAERAAFAVSLDVGRSYGIAVTLGATCSLGAGSSFGRAKGFAPNRSVSATYGRSRMALSES